MDKYEYNLKLDQMKSLFAEEKYEEAADIADSMNWNKVKNPTALLRAGEIYEKTGRYEDSRDVLLMAYDRSPIGRGIIYRLAEVAVKMQDFQAAQDYYDEFVSLVQRDCNIASCFYQTGEFDFVLHIVTDSTDGLEQVYKKIKG